MHPPLLTTVEITRAARAESPDEVEPPNATAFETWLARRFYFMLPATFSVVAQVETAPRPPSSCACRKSPSASWKPSCPAC